MPVTSHSDKYDETHRTKPSRVGTIVVWVLVFICLLSAIALAVRVF